MSEENITKKQHYVPQFHLKRFADERGELHILDLKGKKILPSRAYGGVGYLKFFYAVQTGALDDVSQQIERWLQQLEHVIALALPGIIEKILTNQHINDDDRYTLASFMSMLWLRSPGMRAHLNKMNEDMTKNLMSLSARKGVDEY